MATFSSGLFTTSTPIHQHRDSGFYENSLQSRNISQASISNDIELSHISLRKNLFGQRRSNSENIPINNFSCKQKLLLSQNSIVSRRDASSSKETPRVPRRCLSLDKSVHFTETSTPRQSHRPFLRNSIIPLKRVVKDDSGYCSNTESSRSMKYESCEIPLLPVLENSLKKKENLKEESLAHFKHFLKASGSKKYANLSTYQMLRLYNIYRFQKMGLKPSISDLEFCDKHLLVNEKDAESEMLLVSWKDKLECIAASHEVQTGIDFLKSLYKLNAHLVVSKIFSCLSGRDLQSVSCVNGLWRKLVLKDRKANLVRLNYLKERKELKEKMERKNLFNPFQRPPNFRLLQSIENAPKDQLHMKKAIKDINFEAFIEVGRSGDQRKPMKCPSCGYLSLQDKQIITKCICLFCGFEFCNDCLKPYSNWHHCSSDHLPIVKPLKNSKKYLRRL